jgi:ABC-type polysaccharide/polyol phosphate export permease
MYSLSKHKRIKSKDESRLFKIGFLLGIKEVTKPNLAYRLGIIWLILDPFITSAIYAFLIVILRGDVNGLSIVIGVLLLGVLNKPITSTMAKVQYEPFPLKHTSSRLIIYSLLTQYIIQSILIGFSGTLILFLLTEIPIILFLLLPLVSAILSIIGVGLGLIIGPIQVSIRDISKIVSYILTLSFFGQAVIYSYSDTSGLHRQILSLLPHTIFAEYIRSVLNDAQYPFSLSHALLVSIFWLFFSSIGILRYETSRWRASTW